MSSRTRFLPVILIVLALSTFISLYAYNAIELVTEPVADGTLRLLLRLVYWLITAGFSIAFGLRIVNSGLSPGKPGLTENMFGVFVSILVSNLVMALVLFAGDAFRCIIYVLNAVTGTHAGLAGGFMPERYPGFAYTAVILSVFVFLAFLYGITKGRHRYKVHKHTLFFKDLPAAFNGFRIVQISDVHAGSFSNTAEVQKGVNLVNAQKPDLFVFTGDLVNNTADEILPYINLFKQIRAPYGQFAVLGNHDYGDYVQWPSPAHKKQNIEQLLQHHRDLGYRLLLDESVTISKGDDTIYLLGVQNWGKGFGERGNLNKALLQVDPTAFKILLSHDPSHWDEVVKRHPSPVHLTLSGHTHGMQMGIELPFFKWSPVKFRYKNWSGLAEEMGRYLYVNRGFGFIGFLGRVGIWPEITVIDLKKK